MDQNTQTLINGLIGGLVGGITSYIATKFFNKQYEQEQKNEQNENESPDDDYDFTSLIDTLYSNKYNIKKEIKLIQEFTNKHIQKVSPTDCFAICINGKNFNKIFKEFNEEYYNNNQLNRSSEFTLSMERTASDLMHKFHASSSYIYSDKIILIFSVTHEKSSHMYNGDKNKLIAYVSAFTLQQFMYHFNGICSESLPSYKSLNKLFRSEYNIIFNVNMIVFPTECHLAEFIINNIDNCFSDSYTYNFDINPKSISESYYNTICYGTFLKREIYEKENLNKTRVNERKQIIRCNIDYHNFPINNYSTIHFFKCFVNFVSDKYINIREPYEKVYNIRITNKKVMKEMTISDYYHKNIVMITTYLIDPNEVNYEITLRPNDYIEWLKYRNDIIVEYDTNKNNDINLVEYITTKFVDWIAKNNISII
jgi:hypothetical protein